MPEISGIIQQYLEGQIQTIGRTPVIESKTITENGTYTAPEGVDGYSPVTVNVPAPQPVIESKTITENGTYTAPEGVDGYSPVTVNVPAPQPVIESKTITENGTYTAPEGVDGYSPVTVNVPLPANAYLLKSVTTPTPIASFIDGEEMVMSSLKVAIEPFQSGSGDPSPTNIRPISGWDECNVSVVGKNWFDENFDDWEVRDSYLVLDNKLPSTVELNMSFTDNDTSVDLNGIYLGFISNYTSGAPVTYRWIIQGNNIGSSTSNLIGSVYCDQIFIYPNNETTFNKIKQRYNIQVEVGTTATSYEPYNGQTYTIDLDGTRYGGEVDVVSGIVTPCPYYASYNGEELTGEWMSDRDVYSPNTTPTIGAQVVNIGASGTPVSIHPTAIKSLDGVNNVYANTGDITDAEYFSKET